MSSTADKQRKNSIGKPFKKGQSGNPKGRPKMGESLTEILRSISETPEPGEKLARKEKLAVKMWADALAGNWKLMIYLYDRLDGKPLQAIESKNTNVNLDVTATEADKARVKANMQAMFPGLKIA